jgi:hypothetical protein
MFPNPDGGQLSLFFTGAPAGFEKRFPKQLNRIGKITLAQYLRQKISEGMFVQES